jgi:hypothetical protein
MKARADGPKVTKRRAELQALHLVAYWVVLSYQDGLDLLAGHVPNAVRAQVRTDLKRGRAESAAEYAARVREAEVIPPDVKTTKGGLAIE